MITDPPYGTQGLAGGYGRRQLHDKGDGLAQVIANDFDLSAFAAAFPLCLNLIVDGWLMAFFAPRKTPALVEATRAGNWFGGIVWDKGAPGLGYHIRYAHEDIAVFKIGEPPRPSQPILSVVRGAAPSEQHPHEKPVSALAPLCLWAADAGETILDPFMGSGSTGVAAVAYGRKFIGIELDPKHFETACRRIEQEQWQQRLLA